MQKYKKEKVRSGRSKIRDLGKRGRTVNSQSAGSQCYSVDEKEYIEFEVRESKTGRLKFLLDTGPGICLVKSTKLLSTTEFDPQQKVKVKSIDSSILYLSILLHFYNTIHIKFYIKLLHNFYFILQFRLLCNTLLI
jgi:hypothetical protein